MFARNTFCGFVRPDGYDEAAYHQQNDILTDRTSGIITFTIQETLTD